MCILKADQDLRVLPLSVVQEHRYSNCTRTTRLKLADCAQQEHCGLDTTRSHVMARRIRTATDLQVPSAVLLNRMPVAPITHSVGIMIDNVFIITLEHTLDRFARATRARIEIDACPLPALVHQDHHGVYRHRRL